MSAALMDTYLTPKLLFGKLTIMLVKIRTSQTELTYSETRIRNSAVINLSMGYSGGGQTCGPPHLACKTLVSE
jgi:hypothetical protein